MSYYRSQLEDWLAELDVKADIVVDIGGAQMPVKGRTKSWQVKDYKILDLPEWDLEQSWQNRKYPYADIVFCLEVFEYLIDPLQAMRNISRVLYQDGKAYVTFAFVYPLHQEIELDSLRYTENGIRRLAERAGLEVTNITYRTDKTGLLQRFYSLDGMHPAKGYPHHNATGFIAELTNA